MMNNTIFKCTCKNNTALFKYLIDIVSQVSSVESIDTNKKSIRQVYFKISSSCLEICSDQSKIVYACIKIDKKFFQEYNFCCDGSEDNEDNEDIDENVLCIGISLDIIKSCFKYVHRTDVMEILIEKDEYSNFPDNIKFVMNKTKGFNIKLNIVQNIDSGGFEHFVPLVEIPSSRFSNIYKEVGGVKKQVKVAIDKGLLKMSSNMVDIAENWVMFETQSAEAQGEFIVKSGHFKIVSKLSVFDKKVKLSFHEPDILLQTNIVNAKGSDGVLGEIKVCVKGVPV